jgi:3-dehydroquinate dehydratase
MKEYNVTAQVYKLNDPYKQHLLINQVFLAHSSEDAINQFKISYSPSIEFHIVKIHSAEEMSQGVA